MCVWVCTLTEGKYVLMCTLLTVDVNLLWERPLTTKNMNQSSIEHTKLEPRLHRGIGLFGKQCASQNPYLFATILELRSIG